MQVCIHRIKIYIDHLRNGMAKTFIVAIVDAIYGNLNSWNLEHGSLDFDRFICFECMQWFMWHDLLISHRTQWSTDMAS